ncbi:gliding motility-associated C-terminal domain-containing protein [Mucilaginibacter phyllosphaerae]|uniref:Gliding motility-associated-like protein n=1 Tax=Mucilaginibacter phyllosphaerae TaxID=1812349 RepID=A0A4Y8AGY0_9SPHI|nr:gliding motility-associated C-terminal domain-containing protein [Mucilaginibacter phyllosphaerae]MBB3968876.1 gliding motility-associated-like protein [Mucilaginibacter phyllosphaerae]TEW67495.1 T9SS type B sorting domain-containing protein [Mucilaginibacter phyllosphaerae]GGH13371.1 hypothetical protein GCM10007352_20760 [Mucilaginibacter phyllosphaerae]
MYCNKGKLYIIALLMLVTMQAAAQVSEGALGDPVVNIDFGSNGTPKLPVTDYTYTSNTCPIDGSYSVGTSTNNCFGGTWHTVTHDHTGNTGGYMMIVNADETPNKEFFRLTTDAGVLCENTTYEFSAYILNLIKQDGQAIKPKITFIIETPEGVQLNLPYTVEIPLSASADGWIKYGTKFTTLPGITRVVIRMVNNAPGGNGNDLLLDDIVFRAFGPVSKAGFAGDINVTDQNACVGQPASYNITAVTGTGFTMPMYQWQQNLNDGNGWTDIAGEVDPASLKRDFPSAKLGIYQYRLGAAEGNNINSLNCRVYTNAISINVTAFPLPPTATSQQVCEGDALTLTATGGATYTWSGPNLQATSQNPVNIPNASAINAGTYHLVITSAGNCFTSADVQVTVNAKPVVNVSPTKQICSGTGTTINAFATDAVKYSWSPAIGLSDANSANPVASPSASTLYTVKVTNASNCVGTGTVQVNVLPTPVVNAGSNKKIFEGQSVKLDGNAVGDVVSYIWTPADYLDNPASLTPIATPPADIIYTLNAISVNNCSVNASSVFVRVYNKIDIPTSFTPNNDGVNDSWNIAALETYPQSLTTILTPNGKQVFQSRGYGKAWDGKFNGSALPAGTYYYIIDFKKDGLPAKSGWVLLMR